MLRISTENSTYLVDTDKKRFKLENSTTPKDPKVHNGEWLNYHQITTPVVGSALNIAYHNPVTNNTRLLSSSFIERIEHVEQG